MAERTTDSLVTFRHPFTLRDIVGTQPPGTYQVETDAKRAAAALALAFDPLRLRFGYGSEAEAKAERLLANRTLLRGAYLARAHSRDHPDDDAIAVAS